jgi:hypothetical protein
VVWFRHKTGEAGFRCPSCAEKHLGCPFRDFTFGVADKKMPTVLSSKKGDVFLPHPADTKGRKTSIKPTPTKRVVQVASMERSRSEGSVTSNRSSETREVTPVIQTSRNTKMPMATSSKPNPSAPTTGDKPPCTEPVHAQYMVVPCPKYQHFPESEHAEFFQNTLNNVFAIFQLSKL